MDGRSIYQCLIIFLRYFEFLFLFSASPSCHRVVLLVEGGGSDEPDPPIQDHLESDGRGSLRTAKRTHFNLVSYSLLYKLTTKFYLTNGLASK